MEEIKNLEEISRRYSPMVVEIADGYISKLDSLSDSPKFGEKDLDFVVIEDCCQDTYLKCIETANLIAEMQEDGVEINFGEKFSPLVVKIAKKNIDSIYKGRPNIFVSVPGVTDSGLDKWFKKDYILTFYNICRHVSTFLMDNNLGNTMNIAANQVYKLQKRNQEQ